MRVAEVEARAEATAREPHEQSHSFDGTVMLVVNLLLKYTVKPQANARKRQ